MTKTTTNGLPTSGYVWGLSMVAPNEAVMGAILGMAKLWGCTDVGYDAIVPKPTKKNPKRVVAGKKGGGRPKGASVKNRKPPAQVMQAFLDHLKDDRFETYQARVWFARGGYRSPNALHNAIGQAKKDGLIKKLSMGVYVRLGRKIVAAKKKEAA